MFWITCKFFIAITLLTGCIYTYIITEVATHAMPEKAYGSLLYQEDKLRGSILIGQPFTKNNYFWPRPSYTDFSTLPAMASNLGPTSGLLKKLVKERAEKWKNSSGKPDEAIPSDLVYASCSNIDPHISPKGAFYQVDRIAKARSLDPAQIAKLNTLIDESTEGKIGMIGPKYINVLLLNKALDKDFSNRASQ